MNSIEELNNMDVVNPQVERQAAMATVTPIQFSPFTQYVQQEVEKETEGLRAERDDAEERTQAAEEKLAVMRDQLLNSQQVVINIQNQLTQAAVEVTQLRAQVAQLQPQQPLPTTTVHNIIQTQINDKIDNLALDKNNKLTKKAVWIFSPKSRTPFCPSRLM